MPTHVLVISGSMGAGKTAVLGEASDLLSALGVVHAAIDLDWLNAGHFPDAAPRDLVFQNLGAVWQNFAAHGINRLLIAYATVSASEIDEIRHAIPESTVVLARLTADIAVMQRRVRDRESGMWRDAYIARSAKLNELLDAAPIENISISNQGRSITEVARQLLVEAGWLT
jgi:hypothetical protein